MPKLRADGEFLKFPFPGGIVTERRPILNSSARRPWYDIIIHPMFFCYHQRFCGVLRREYEWACASGRGDRIDERSCIDFSGKPASAGLCARALEHGLRSAAGCLYGQDAFGYFVFAPVGGISPFDSQGGPDHRVFLFGRRDGCTGKR